MLHSNVANYRSDSRACSYLSQLLILTLSEFVLGRTRRVCIDRGVQTKLVASQSVASHFSSWRPLIVVGRTLFSLCTQQLRIKIQSENLAFLANSLLFLFPKEFQQFISERFNEFAGYIKEWLEKSLPRPPMENRQFLENIHVSSKNPHKG